MRMGIMVKKCWSICNKMLWRRKVTHPIVEAFQQWWCWMVKKALSGLSFCKGATPREEPTRKAALAVHWVCSHIYLEQQYQQTSAATGLVQALDHRGLYAETIGASEWLQHQHSATCD